MDSMDSGFPTSLWLQLLFTSMYRASRTIPTKRESYPSPSFYGPASDDQNIGY